jgi:hypothetical protein
VQFISYEGVIKASNGPAAGRTSVNLPVSESGSDAAGRSLRLTGSGTTYANFSWQACGDRELRRPATQARPSPRRIRRRW